MEDIKIFIINNKLPLKEAIDILYTQAYYKNHLEYWEDYLSQRSFKTITLSDLYSDNRNIIAIKIALEGNIVFMDTSKKIRSFLSGVMFLPSDISLLRKIIAFKMTSHYNYLNVISNIHYNGESYIADEQDITRSCSRSDTRVLRLLRSNNNAPTG